jgi:hypothetical protein
MIEVEGLHRTFSVKVLAREAEVDAAIQLELESSTRLGIRARSVAGIRSERDEFSRSAWHRSRRIFPVQRTGFHAKRDGDAA